MTKVNVIKFHAKWCGPCKMITPIINQLIEEYDTNENVDIQKVDVDENSDFAKSYGIKSVPTILFIVNEEVVDKINGPTNKKNIVDKIEEIISK